MYLILNHNIEKIKNSKFTRKIPWFSPVCEMTYGVRTLKFQNVVCTISSKILSYSSVT